MVKLSINGKPREFDLADEVPLLWALRDEAHMTGTKFGCGMGLCGACTVHVDGVATRSCILPISSLAGKRITTIEAARFTVTGCGPVAGVRMPRSVVWTIAPSLAPV